MRPIQLADIEMAARVLMRAVPTARHDLMQEIIKEATAADHFRQTHGMQHPCFGAGSLMSAAARHKAAPRPHALDRDALNAYAVAIALLADASHQTA